MPHVSVGKDLKIVSDLVLTSLSNAFPALVEVGGELSVHSKSSVSALRISSGSQIVDFNDAFRA